MDKEKTIYRKKIPNGLTDYERPEKLIIKRLKSQSLKNAEAQRQETFLSLQPVKRPKSPYF